VPIVQSAGPEISVDNVMVGALIRQAIEIKGINI
jgi:hypothetical protein